GWEFWAEQEGLPVVTRVADLNYLTARLRDHGVRPLARLATEFWDIYRFRSRLARNGAILFNRLWFRLRFRPGRSMGNAVRGNKAAGPASAVGPSGGGRPVPLEGPSQPFDEGHGRFVRQVGPRPADVGLRVADVAGARRAEDRLQVDAE